MSISLLWFGNLKVSVWETQGKHAKNAKKMQNVKNVGVKKKVMFSKWKKKKKFNEIIRGKKYSMKN